MVDEKEAKSRTLDKVKASYDAKIHGDADDVVNGKLGKEKWWEEEGKGAPKPDGGERKRKQEEEEVGKDGKKQKKLDFGGKKK